MTTRLNDDDLDQLLAEAMPPTPDYSPPGYLADQIVCKRAHSRLRSFRDRCAHAPRGMRLAVAPSAAAVAAVAVALLMAGQQTGRSLETADAATILLNHAAEATLRTRDLPPGRLRYVRDTENLGDGLFVVETWQRQDGSIARRVVTQDGHRRETHPSRPDAGTLPWTGLTDAEILELPAGPDQVIAAIRSAMARPQPVQRIGPDGAIATRKATVPFTDNEVFTAIMALHDVDLPLSSAQRAGLLRAAAMIPGVASLGRVRDPLGRIGNAISIAGDESHEGHGRIYILSPTTGDTLATLDVRGDMVTGWSLTERATAASVDEHPVPARQAPESARYPLALTDQRTQRRPSIAK